MEFNIKELNELIYSLGHTAQNGAMVNKEVNSVLFDKLYAELSRKLEAFDEEVEDEGPEYDGAGFSVKDRYPHFVSNEEADEDYRSTMLQDEQRYSDTFLSDVAKTLSRPKDRFNGVSQFILDFVEASPTKTATFFEMNKAYRTFTDGSNSFHDILKALQIPYKNRPTRRYLYKVKHGVYGIKMANPTNWIVK